MADTEKREAWKQIESAISREDWRRARAVIRARLRRAPDDHWLLTRLGLTYYEQRQYRRALIYARRARRIAEHCPLVIWDYAGTLDMLGRKREALRLFRRLIRRGEDRLAFGTCGEGVRWARSLIADCYYRIARILEEQHQRKKAISAYKAHLALRKPGTRSIYSRREVLRRYRALMP